VNDAMADAEHTLAVKALAQPGRERVERRLRVADVFQRPLTERGACLILRFELRRRADTFDLAARFEAPEVPVGDRIHAELEARGPGVEDEDECAHGEPTTPAAASAGGRGRRAWPPRSWRS